MLELQSFSKNLEENNWQIIQTQDLSNKFIIWYSEFLTKLRKQKNNLEKNFSKEDIDQVDSSFSFFLEKLLAKEIGGIVIYSVKQ